MRTRRWLSVAVYAVCALAVVEALGWVTYQTIRLERRERDARAEAHFQESIRLALWRMENVLGPLLAQEAARPYFHYSPFYPAERAYTRMWQPVEPGEVLVPSPLLEGAGGFVRLHFQIDADGALSSPQAPTGEMRALAESSYVDREFLVYAEGLLGELARLTGGGERVALGRLVGALPAEGATAAGEVMRGRAEMGYPETLRQELQSQDYQARQRSAELAKEVGELSRRGQVAGQTASAPQTAVVGPAGREVAGLEVAGRRADEAKAEGEDAAELGVKVEGAGGVADAAGEEGAEGAAAAHAEVRQTTFDAVWVFPEDGGEAELMLRRTVWIGGRPTVQGVWLDWPGLRRRLCEAAEDVLPEADLRPAEGGGAAAAPQPQLLAGIPALLIPGPVPVGASWEFTPTHSTLVFTWIAVLVAVGAIGLVLRASMDLSDRRGRFVSAVTHELRTPLTTFCLYTEMLADGVVAREEARREYLSTLKDESRRLARIVENVLAYARLGEGRPKTRPAPIDAGELLEGVLPALERRAAQDGMLLEAEISGARGAVVRADGQTVERILLNLVDNSCKYASEAEDRRLHVRASVSGAGVEVEYEDHGPGIPRREQARVFQPFHRARRDAEGPKAGMGLGLALARGLALELGGDLSLTSGPREGARFRLLLPVAGGRRR